MPFILAGAPIAAVFFFLVPFARDVNLWFMIVVILIMNFAMAIFRAPVIALMPDISPSKDRSKANGVINFMGGVGSLFAFLAGSMLYTIDKKLPFIVGAVILVVSSFLVIIFVKEPVAGEFGDNERTKKISFLDAFKDLTVSIKDLFFSKEKSELWLLLAIFLWFCGFNAIETFFTSYGKYHLGIEESRASFALGLFSLTFMLFSIPAGFIGAKFGRKKTIMSGIVILLFMSVIISFLDNFNLIQAVLVFGGLGWACININSLPMVVDMVLQEKVGGRTGLYYFFSMLAAISAPPFVGLLIDHFGYQSMLVFSIAGFLSALVMMSFVKKGEKKDA
jgi:MFS family permease